ncbi:MAG: HAD-IA family hydrolase [Micromonosporaceae bacterium]|nr:HAD-IA family hydrolase [Micromonosporaceae bacterium]
MEAVLVDFHGTIAQVEDPVDWVLAAAQACGLSLPRLRATALADLLVAAGRAGGPLPQRVPPHLVEEWANRDLYEYAHRAAYTGLARAGLDRAGLDRGPDGSAASAAAQLPEALYDRLLVPDGWTLYPDTLPTLAALHRQRVPIAVVSNIGFDIRPVAEALGFARYIDAFVLSYEVGRCKPDPAIFQHACTKLGVPPERALMVGDTPADGAAVHAGCRAYLLPPAPAGTTNGLAAVLRLVGVDPSD